MADRTLRGSRLGATSYETDRNVDLAPRTRGVYDCPRGHHFDVTFAADAEVPGSWECRTCGVPALLADGGPAEAKKGKPARTHWDMLLERRNRTELEELLQERLSLLHEGRQTA